MEKRAEKHPALLQKIERGFYYVKLLTVQSKVPENRGFQAFVKCPLESTFVRRKKNGRLGYCQAAREKDTIISPSQYGAFLQKRGKRR